MMALEREGGGEQSLNMEALIKKVLSDEESRKKQQAQIDKIENNVRVIGNLICKDGVCTLATKQDLTRLAEAQGGKGDLTQYNGQELWDALKGRPSSLSDLEGVFLKKLKAEPDYMKQAAEDPQFQEAFLDGICTTPGCREKFNKQVEEYRKKHPEQKDEKESWLVKKK